MSSCFEWLIFIERGVLLLSVTRQRHSRATSGEVQNQRVPEGLPFKAPSDDRIHIAKGQNPVGIKYGSTCPLPAAQAVGATDPIPAGPGPLCCGQWGALGVFPFISLTTGGTFLPGCLTRAGPQLSCLLRPGVTWFLIRQQPKSSPHARSLSQVSKEPAC